MSLNIDFNPRFCDMHTVMRGTDPCDCPPRMADHLLKRDELAMLPTPEPLIAGTLDRRTVAMLAGYWGTGKSFLALDWASCVATGKAWQGRHVEQGRVLYVASEGAYGLHSRLSAWESAWDHAVDPERLLILPRPVQLADEVQLRELGRIVAEYQPDLIAVDTVARCAVGLDENSAKDMGRFVDALYRLRSRSAAGSVLAVHHTGKDKTTVRGSSAMEAGVDTVYQVEADGAELRLSRTKRKDGPVTDEMRLRLASYEGLPSVVVERASSHSTLSVELEVAERVHSTFRSTFGAIGEATSRQLREAAGLPESSYYKGLNHLVAQGVLVREGRGTGARYRLAQEVVS